MANDNIPPMPTIPPPPGYQYGLTVESPTSYGGLPTYRWVLEQTPKSLLDSGGGGAAYGRNAIDEAHYGRQDAMTALRDAADAAYQRGQLSDSLYGHQATAGQQLLDTVVKLMQDPTAGPLGLTAYAKYGGGAQNIAAGTGGTGIPNPNASLLDELLSHLKGAVTTDNNVFNRLNAGADPTSLYAAAAGGAAGANPPGTAAPADTSGAADLPKIDPNKAPMVTPEAAAQAPNDEAQNWIKAWQAFNPGKTYGVDQGGVSYDPNAPAGPPDLLKQGQNSPLWNAQIPGLAAGGEEPGLTIGGQKHYITNEKGDVVANLTEDGKPETVKPLPEGGGVEVIPEDPARKAAYLAAKQSGQLLGKLLGSVLYPETAATAPAPAPAAPGLADGGSALFPAPLGFGQGGSSQDRMEQIGSYFKPNSPTDLPTEATAPDFQTRLTGYAKLLGGALSAGNRAILPDQLKALNAGKAPSTLLTANALSTMLPSQRSNYYALLQQMGLGNPKDVEDQIKRFTPTGIGGTSVASGAFA